MKKKLDSSIQELIEGCVKSGHRSFFVLVGDHGKDQVENLHRILCNARVKARPSVLWCYKKELGFSTHKQKRMKELKKEEKRGLRDPDRDDPFELFITTTNIRWTYYKDTDKILGQTFGACVLQDFEAMTPNVLARTIETVEGGGMVILLLNTVKSLKQLYSLSMDVHTKFRTSSHDHVVPRFNERFILSLSQCKTCMALDDELNVLPLQSLAKDSRTSHAASSSSFERSETKDELKQLKSSLEDTPIIGDLVAATKTSDQAQVLVSFFDIISSEQQLSFSKPVISLTAARGRGKSASIGLCVAGAVAYGYSSIYITAPSKENLFTTFSILIEGLKTMKYVEHTDFEVIYDGYAGGNSGDGKRHLKIPSRINIFKKHKQTIQYIEPNRAQSSLAGADILAIDEAASIPLPVVKKLLGHCATILSTTVHGYEGTGRSLSLKLLDQLRSQREADHTQGFKFSGSGEKVQKSSKKSDKVKHEERWAEAARHNSSARKTLYELTLTTPIRYSVGDPVESWLNTFLCLDLSATNTRLVSSVPAPKDCELFAVNRDALFSHHSLSETLLQQIWSIYSTAHYKNSPNDLQALSDAPAHRLYVLMGPQRGHSGGGIPDILCVVQVAFEGKISQKVVHSELARGSTPSGDLIPWTLSQQYNDSEFPRLSGARVVRIATNPDAQGMGYGSRALELLSEFFSGEASTLESEGEIIRESENDSSLLVPLREKRAERLHWLGSSFGLTNGLHKFWKRQKYEVCYVRQTENDVTGEHSTIVIKELSTKGMKDAPHAGWSKAYKLDYRRRLLSMLGYTFTKLDLALALSLVDPDKEFASSTKTLEDGSGEVSGFREVYGSSPLGSQELLSAYLTHYDMKRLELYSRNMVDYHLIMDTLPIIARLFFLGRLSECRLSALQVSILLAVGLQHRTMDNVCVEMQLPINQILAFFNKAIRKISSTLRKIVENEVVKNIEGIKKIAGEDLASSTHGASSVATNEGSESVRVLTKMDIPEASEEVKASRVVADYGREKSNDHDKGKEKKRKKNKKLKDSSGNFESKKQKV